MKRLSLCFFLLCSVMTFSYAQIAPPTLNSPADGYVYPSTVKPLLKMNTVTGASYYMFHWSEDSTFATYNSYTMSSSYTGLNVNGLKFGTTYYWRVYAITANYADTSAASEVWSFTTCDAPTITSPNDGVVFTSTVMPTIKWTQITGASRYIYQCDTSSSFNSPMCLTYTYTGYNSSGSNAGQLHFGKTYYLRMKATNTDESDTSSWSAVRSFTTCDAPIITAPDDGVVFTSTVKPTIKWTQITGASRYIYQCDTSSSFNSPMCLTYTYTGYNSSGSNAGQLHFGKTYYLRMKATNTDESDTSSWSAVRSFTTCNAPTLTSPSNGVVYTANVGPTVDWSSITGASYYILAWDTVSTFDSPLYETFTTTGTSVNIWPIKFATTYYWRVCATNTNNSDTSAWSAAWTFTTSDAPILTSPSDGYVYPNSVTPTLKCTAITRVGKYIYQWDTTATFNSPLCASTTKTSNSTSIGPLKLGTIYYWRMRATNYNDDSDTSSWSAPWSFTTGGSVPTLSSPSNGATAVRLKPLLDWNTISSCDFYDYECDTTPQFNSTELQSGAIAAGTSEVRLNQLRYGTTYYWHVRIRLNSDTSSWSPVWHFTTAETIALTSPSNGSTLSRTINPTLDWDYINDGDYYEYQYDLSPDFDSPELVSGKVAVGTSEVELTEPLRFGATYYWRVREYTSFDTTMWSATWHFTTPGEIALVSPANGTTNVGASITLDWDYIRGGTIYEYQYDVTPAFNSNELVEGSIQVGTSQVTISNLEENHLYYWRVRELSAVDTTPWSNVWHFYTHMTPVYTDIYDTACGSYTWNGQTYTESGEYSRHYVTELQVDSTATLHLIIHPAYNISLSHSICEGESYNFYGQNLTTAGTYTHNMQTVSGCDSILTLSLTVNALPTPTITGNTSICQGSSTTLTASGADSYTWSTGDNTATVTINAFGIYTVTGTSAEGCSNTADVIVLVSPLPVITITGETDFCSGESTTLTANGGETYLWNDGTTSAEFTVNVAGTYQVIGYNAAGCYSMGSITVNQWPSVTSEFTVTTGEDCYEWNGQAYCQSGNYTQTLQTIHGCDSIVTLHLNIETGINNYLMKTAMKVYPNPSSDIVNVQLTMNHEQLGNAELQVFDVFGKLLDVVETQCTKSPQTTQIDLSLYANGVYYIKAMNDGNMLAVKKVVKNN